jgi:hypothetical protein
VRLDLSGWAIAQEFLDFNLSIANGLPPGDSALFWLVMPLEKMKRDVANVAFQRATFAFSHIFQLLGQTRNLDFRETSLPYQIGSCSSQA